MSVPKKDSAKQAARKASDSLKPLPAKILEVLKTDLSGQTEVIELETPPLEYSMEPGLNQPYSEYNLKVTAPGFEPVEVSGSQMLSGQLALQNLSLEPTITETASYEVLAISTGSNPGAVIFKLYSEYG